MFVLIHEMRSEIITSSAFGGERAARAILFAMTMDRQVGGSRLSDHLSEQKQVVPFLKATAQMIRSRSFPS